MLWMVVFFVIWTSAIAAGIGVVVTARQRPGIAKKLSLGPACVAGLYLAWEFEQMVRYAHCIPLDSQADHARLQGYLIGSGLYALVVAGPLIVLCMVAFRRVRTAGTQS